MADSPTSVELQSRINATRREYEDLRGGFEQQLGRHFTDAGEVADRLLSVVDEFGCDHALQLMAERPDNYGVRHAASEGDWREAAAGYGGDVERLVELHEQLDDLTREREQAESREPAKAARIVNIQGREYQFDAARSELREMQSDARFPVELEHGEPKLTAIEQAMRDSKAGKAEPQPDRDRTRGR